MHLYVQSAPRPSSRQRRVISEQEKDYALSGIHGNMIIQERVKCFFLCFSNSFYILKNFKK